MRDNQEYPVTKRRASAGTQQYTVSRQPRPVYDEPSDDDLYDYQPRMPTSTRRYDLNTDQAYTQRQLPAPKDQRSRPGQRYHPLVYVGLILVCAMALVIISSVVGNWWQRTVDSFKYGYPRAFQTDADVGHGDQKHPISHFVAINDHGLIEVLEIPGDPSKAKPYLYIIAQISSDNADQIPVTLSFADVDGDGKVDIQVTVNGTTYILFNTGTTFKEGN